MTIALGAHELSKSYSVSDKSPGWRGTMSHLLRRRTREVKAVREVTFSVEEGEVVGFLGANGAGKTTTLKMLTGLIRPSSGTARVLGHVPFERRKEFLQQVSLVMGQKQQLLWDLPAHDSLEVNAAVYNIPPAALRERTQSLASMLELSDQLHKPVRKLSLGERMKCELLAALLHEPRLLLLDEPTLGLDINAQEALRRFLAEYNRKFGATLLLTSHYMADIVALASRVLVIHEGQLIYDGSLQGLVERFAPQREVRLELSQPLERRALEAFGSVEELDGLRATLMVERSALTDTVGRLLAELRPRDLSVSDPPIERVVGRLFQGGLLAPLGQNR